MRTLLLLAFITSWDTRQIRTPVFVGRLHHYAPTYRWGVLGDSTAAARLGTTGWPAKLTSEEINHAYSGATTEMILMDQWPQARVAVENGVIISGGINDIAPPGTDSASAIFARLQAIAEDALTLHRKVVFVSILPANGAIGTDAEPRRLAVNALESAWAAANGQTFIDLDASPVNCGGNPAALCDEDQVGDHVHPSQIAQDAIAAYIQPRLP